MDNKNYSEYEPETLKKVQEVSIEVLEEFKRICKENNLTYFTLFGSAIGAVRHGGFIPWDDDLDVGMLRGDFEKFLTIAENLGEESKCELMSVLVDKENSSTVTKFQKKGTKFIGYYAKGLKANVGIAIDVFPIDVVPEDYKLRAKQARKAFFYEKLMFLRKNPKPNLPLTGIKKVIAQIICYIAWAGLNVFHISSVWLYKKFDAVLKMYSDSDSKYVSCLIAPVKKDYYWEKDTMLPVVEVPFENTTCSLPGNNHEILTKTYGDYMQIPPVEKRVNHAPLILKF